MRDNFDNFKQLLANQEIMIEDLTYDNLVHYIANTARILRWYRKRDLEPNEDI